MPLCDTWALVPIKSLDSGKSRLSPILEPHERAALIPAMVEDVFDAFAGFGEMPVLVVTGDLRVAELARSRGFHVLVEQVCVSETQAIELATSHAIALGARGTLVTPADIPLLTPQDLAEILSASPNRGTLLVPAWDGRGTNAVIRRPGDLIPLRFGNESFLPHRAAAEATGFETVILQNERIGIDLDNPDDLRRFWAVNSRTRTRRVLEALQIESRLA